MVRLEQEEQDEWRPVAGREVELERYRQYARATFKKDRRFTKSCTDCSSSSRYASLFELRFALAGTPD